MRLLETKAEYDQFLKDNVDKLVVIDFYADWCGPCKMITPKLLQMEKSHPDVAFAKVNVDDNEDVALECKINAMPTFHFIKNGKKVEEITGANEDKIRNLLEKYTSAPVTKNA